MRPGVTTAPSMIVAPDGIDTSADGPTASILPFSIRTTPSVIAGPACV